MSSSPAWAPPPRWAATSPSTWEAALAGESGRAPVRRRLGGAVRHPRDLRGDHQGHPSEVLDAPRAQAHGPLGAVRDHRGPRGVGRRRHPRGRPASVSVRSSRRASAASGRRSTAWDTAAGEGRSPGPAHDGPDAHAELAGGVRLARVRRAGRRARARLGVRLRRRGHRLRRGHDPRRSGRRGHRRWHRGDDPPDAHRGVRGVPHAVAAQRRPRRARRGRTTSTATASSSARARAWSCWRAPSTPPPAVRASTRRIAGVGLSADGYHITSPEPSGDGQIRAMRAALQESGVAATDVVHVNAHATSTVVGDLIEARSIRGVLGDDADHVALSATKSMTGHLLGGAGALETIFTVLAVHERQAPPDDQRRRPRPRAGARPRPGHPARSAGRRRSPRSTTRSASAGTTWPWWSRQSDRSTTTRGAPGPGRPSRRSGLALCSAPRGRVPASADPVQPAHGCSGARVPEGLQLVVPRLAQREVELGAQASRGRRRARAPRGCGPRGRRRCRATSVAAWKMPRSGVWLQREPSTPGLGSSVTS